MGGPWPWGPCPITILTLFFVPRPKAKCTSFCCLGHWVQPTFDSRDLRGMEDSRLVYAAYTMRWFRARAAGIGGHFVPPANVRAVIKEGWRTHMLVYAANVQNALR